MAAPATGSGPPARPWPARDPAATGPPWGAAAGVAGQSGPVLPPGRDQCPGRWHGRPGTEPVVAARHRGVRAGRGVGRPDLHRRLRPDQGRHQLSGRYLGRPLRPQTGAGHRLAGWPAGSFLPWAATAILLGAGTAMVYPTLLAAISDVAHPTWRATAVGVYRLWRIPASPWAPCSPAWWPTSPAWRPPSGWLPPSPPPPAWSWPGACTRPTDRHGSPDSAAAVSDLSGPQHAARPPVPGRPDRPAAAPRSWWPPP
jgi:hypothetical protein